jgi:hypothetical protein
MIEIQKNYKLTLTEQQAQELYQLLRTTKRYWSSGSTDKEFEIDL